MARTCAWTKAPWPWRAGLGLVAAALLWALPAGAEPGGLERFFGSYVGRAQVEDLEAGSVEQRDMDIVISPFREAGFRIDWVNVSLIDGRRDQPGVKRRAQSVRFEPAAEQGFFVEAEASSLFQERAAMQPLRGDPVRWARLDGDTLQVATFVVLDDGRYELQVYDRIRTEAGLDIRFERIVDDQVLRRITGRTVRAAAGGSDD
jgi:hypothetical protein